MSGLEEPISGSLVYEQPPPSIIVTSIRYYAPGDCPQEAASGLAPPFRRLDPARGTKSTSRAHPTTPHVLHLVLATRRRAPPRRILLHAWPSHAQPRPSAPRGNRSVPYGAAVAVRVPAPAQCLICWSKVFVICMANLLGKKILYHHYGSRT